MAKGKWSRWSRERTEMLLAKMMEDIVEDPNFQIHSWEKENGVHRCGLRMNCERYGILNKYLKAKTAYELKKAYKAKDGTES